MKCLLLALSLFAFQTQDLPAYGTLADLKGMTRVYVTSEDGEARERIVKALGKDKGLVVVGSPDEAEFFVEYGELKSESHASDDLFRKDRKLKAQMRVFTVSGGRRQIAWSKTQERETEHMMGLKMYDSGRPEGRLTADFLKALKKAHAVKK